MARKTPNTVAELNPWTRLLYLIFFVAVFNIVEIAVYLVLATQFVFHLFTRRPNPRLQDLGCGIARYVQLIVSFLTYHSDELPFPFGTWPRD